MKLKNTIPIRVSMGRITNFEQAKQFIRRS